MPLISESVLVALITLAAGVFGALFGFLGGVIAAKINAKAQVQQTVVQERFRVRVETYQNALNAFNAMLGANYSEESYGAFLKATNAACIVSSATTAAQLMIWQDLVKESPSSARAKEALTSAFIAMQHDLDNFTEPRVLKNKWPKKQCLQLDMLSNQEAAGRKQV